MIAYILGRNRVEIGKIKTKDLEKHFYTSRGQTYKMYPDTLMRVERYECGRRIADEEAIVYCENAVEPFHPRNGIFDPRIIMAQIDEHKMMTDYRKPSSIFAKYKAVRKDLLGALPLIIVGFILLWSFLQ